jgi:multidrug efflux pump subunit AcrA (membrane-fusion protein)
MIKEHSMARRFLPLIILAIGIGGFVLLKATRPAPEAVSATERAWLVEVMSIIPAEHAPTLPLYGQLVAPDQVRITAPLAGRIAERPVREGQRVAEGELLVAMDSADVQPLLDRVKADVADLEAQVESETIRVTNDRQALVSERAILQNAQRQFERTQSLVGRNLSSQEDLDAAADALARARLTVTVRERAIAEHPSRLKSLNARLNRAQSALVSARLDAERARVTAPFDAVVTDIQVAPGDQINPNTPLLSVYPVQGLELRATVPDRFHAELQSAVEAGTRLEAVSEDGLHRFVLTGFAGTSNPSGTEAILSLQQPAAGASQRLRPGGLLPVMLQRTPVRNSIAMPYSALYGSDTVYLMTSENRMRRVRVDRLGEVSAADGERHLLVANPELQAGQSLITTHLPNAMSGLKVQLAGSGSGNSTDDGAAE